MELIDLPVDILSLFIDQLIQRDLKRLRLVCRTLHEITVLRIPRVFLSPSRANIDAFYGILQHKTLRKHVREIIWDDARLHFYRRQPLRLSQQEAIQLREDLRLQVREVEKTYDLYLIEVQGQFRYSRGIEESNRMMELWGSNIPKCLSLEDSFDLYNRLYDEQQVIIESREDVEALRLGLLSFPALKRVTVTPEAWRVKSLFPRYETPFFRSLPPGFKMPIPWPWLGSDYAGLSDDQLDRLMLPWDQSHEEWRGYQIVVDTLLATASMHQVEELTIDTNGELTGISYQLFTSHESIGYTRTVQLLQTTQLTTLELCLNTQTAEETDFSCLHNQLLKSALSHLTSLKHLALAVSIDTLDHINMELVEQGWIGLDEIIPLDILAPSLQYLKLCHFLIKGESLYAGLLALTALTTISLDSIALSDDFPWRSFFLRTKEQSIQAKASSPIWNPDRPDVIFKARSSYFLDERRDSSAEIKAFLYGNGDCPFTEESPQVAVMGTVSSVWEEGMSEYMTWPTAW